MLDFESMERDYLESDEEEVVVGACVSCGDEIVLGEPVIVYDGMMCHDDAGCIRDMLLENCGASEEFAREDLI